LSVSAIGATIGDVTACARCRALLPADARFCPSCAAPVKREAEPSGERKLATVLFADLVGSTALAGDEDPERTRGLLDRFYDAMAAEIEQAGGTVEKFVGDAVMAAFGAPAAQEDHAERALHAAVAMRRRLAELFGDRLALRIGVNTGEVVVGQAREGGSFVTGDTVNVGARLEQAAAPGEILAGERTVLAARGAFEFGDPSTIEAKGKPGGVACRRLVRALSLMRPRGLGGLRSVFVGRDEELGQLQDTYRRAADGDEPQLVTILGDAGVGKTRLVRELWAWLAEQEPQPVQRTGRCLSYGQGITYWPLGEVLKEHFGILESDSPDAVAERIEDRFLGLTLGLPLDEELHPLAARERMHDAWVAFVEQLARERPAVVLIEDLHWAEDDLCDLLQTLVGHVRGPLLLVATARPELLDSRPGWGGTKASATRLHLDSLPPAASRRLLDELLGLELPASLRDVVVERAEGNPFFVEELVATLIDKGVLERVNGSWSVGELPQGFSVPDSVQAVLAARIDLLPPAEKSALQAASVIGRVFWTSPVYELLEGASPDFGLLEERDFVRRRSGSSMLGQREYVIKHALTREVAYGSLPKAKRAQLHAAFAAWLEGSAEGDDEHASLLAHHYAEAVRPEDLDLAWSGREDEAARLRAKALEWSRRAAALAIGRYEIDDGLVLLHRALELEEDPAEQGQLWYEIGRANAFKYDGEAFTAAMEKSIELGGPSADVYTELAFQTVQRAGMWKQRPDMSVVRGWIANALELSGEGSPQRTKALLSKSLWDEDEEAARAAWELAERMGDVGLRSHGLHALSNCRWGACDYEQACEQVRERLDLISQISDPDHRANAYFVADMIYAGAGRIGEARSTAARLQEEAKGLTPHHRVHGIGHVVAVEAFAGCWGVVRELTSEAERTVEANVATPCPLNPETLLECAVAHAHAGDEAEARRLEAKADALGMEGYGFAVHPPKLRLALLRGDFDEVRRLVDALDPDELEPAYFATGSTLMDALLALGDWERIEQDAPRYLQPGAYVEPFALRAFGVARDDRSLLGQAEARFEAMGLAWHAGETRRLAHSV
jgi:class 3 adenylate cyclase